MSPPDRRRAAVRSTSALHHRVDRAREAQRCESRCVNERCILCEHPGPRTSARAVTPIRSSAAAATATSSSCPPCLGRRPRPSTAHVRPGGSSEIETAEARRRRTRTGHRAMVAASTGSSMWPRTRERAASRRRPPWRPRHPRDATQAPVTTCSTSSASSRSRPEDPATLRHVLEHLDDSGSAEQGVLRVRLTAEFDALEPRHRRELLEDEALRGFLEHVGVVSAWNVSTPSDRALRRGAMRPASPTSPHRVPTSPAPRSRATGATGRRRPAPAGPRRVYRHGPRRVQALPRPGRRGAHAGGAVPGPAGRTQLNGWNRERDAAAVRGRPRGPTRATSSTRDTCPRPSFLNDSPHTAPGVEASPGCLRLRSESSAEGQSSPLLGVLESPLDGVHEASTHLPVDEAVVGR